MGPIFSFCSPLPYDNANSKDLHLHSLKFKEKSKETVIVELLVRPFPVIALWITIVSFLLKYKSQQTLDISWLSYKPTLKLGGIIC